MEALLTQKESGQNWNLQTDKLLLKCLQELSGDMMTCTQGLENSLAGLDTEVKALTSRLGHASASFIELCQTRFVEQGVSQSILHQHEDISAKRPPALTANNADQMVRSKYKEALQLAASAFREEDSSSQAWKPLPNIYGSPEYLQDATFGIGGTAANASEDGSTVDEDERRDKLSPLPGDEVSLETDEEEEEEEEAAPDTAIPDFRAMLEAALRGEFDEGLDEDLAEDQTDFRGNDPGFSGGARQPAEIFASDPANAHSHKLRSGKDKEDLLLGENVQPGHERGGSRGSDSLKRQGSGHSPDGDSLSVSEMSSFGQNMEHWDALVPRASETGETSTTGQSAEENRASLHRLLQGQGDLFSDE